MALHIRRLTDRELVMQNRDKGIKCPTCDQFAKVYRRKITTPMARTLITMWRAGGHAFDVHTPSLPGDTHEASQLSWWDLIEDAGERRPDGGRAGWWKITDRGVRFVNNELRVPTYALIYDGKVLGHEGDPVSIVDALGTRFDYAELMSR